MKEEIALLFVQTYLKLKREGARPKAVYLTAEEKARAFPHLFQHDINSVKEPTRFRVIRGLYFPAIDLGSTGSNGNPILRHHRRAAKK